MLPAGLTVLFELQFSFGVNFIALRQIVKRTTDRTLKSKVLAGAFFLLGHITPLNQGIVTENEDYVHSSITDCAY